MSDVSFLSIVLCIESHSICVCPATNYSCWIVTPCHMARSFPIEKSIANDKYVPPVRRIMPLI